MQIMNHDTQEQAHDLLMRRMNADMQKIENASNFARQATLAEAVNDIKNGDGLADHNGPYLETFERAYALALAMESRVEEHIKVKAASYESEMRLLLENVNQPRIEMPEKRIVLR